MNCNAHPDAAATRSCHACLRPLCGDCTQEVLGAFYCESCLAERLQPQAAMPPPVPRKRRIKIPFVAGLLSFPLCGLGQVYNGLLGRALFQFVGLVMLGWSIGQVGGAGEDLLLPFVLAYMVWVVVDAVRTAKDINKLGRVPDPDEAAAMGRGAIPGLDRGSKPMGVALMAIGGLLLLSNLGMSRMLTQLIEGIWPLALLLGGIWLVRRSREERRAMRSNFQEDFEYADEDELEYAAEGMER